MRPKRLGSAVALGFGLLATAPKRIRAGFPSLGQEASSTSRDAAELLGDEDFPHANSAFSTTLQQPAPLQGHQPMVLEQHRSPFDPDWYVAQHAEQLRAQQLAATHRHGRYGAIYAYQHPPPPGQVESAAQPSEPQEYDFMHLLQQPDPGDTQSRSRDGGNHPTQHGPSPMAWQLRPQHASQQDSTEVHAYQPNLGPVTVNPNYDAADPVQHVAQYPVSVKKKRGPRSRASRFGQAEGHGGATSSSRPSATGTFGRDGSSSTPAGRPEAHRGEHDMPAATSDQLVHSANTMEGFNASNLHAELKTFAKTVDPNGVFELASISNLEPRVVGESVELRASEAQRRIIKELLAKRFNGKVEISLPNEGNNKVSDDVKMWEEQFISLMKAKKSFEWEFIGYKGNAFFFDFGNFRFRCALMIQGRQANPSFAQQNIKIVGFHKASRVPNLALYIGIVEIDSQTLDAAVDASKERLKQKKFVYKKDGLRRIKMSDGKGEDPELPEQLEQRQELPEQLEQRQELKQLVQAIKDQQWERENKQQQQLATSGNRSRARKSKQQQQQQKQPTKRTRGPNRVSCTLAMREYIEMVPIVEDSGAAN